MMCPICEGSAVVRDGANVAQCDHCRNGVVQTGPYEPSSAVGCATPVTLPARPPGFDQRTHELTRRPQSSGDSGELRAMPTNAEVAAGARGARVAEVMPGVFRVSGEPGESLRAQLADAVGKRGVLRDRFAATMADLAAVIRDRDEAQATIEYQRSAIEAAVAGENAARAEAIAANEARDAARDSEEEMRRERDAAREALRKLVSALGAQRIPNGGGSPFSPQVRAALASAADALKGASHG